LFNIEIVVLLPVKLAPGNKQETVFTNMDDGCTRKLCVANCGQTAADSDLVI